VNEALAMPLGDGWTTPIDRVSDGPGRKIRRLVNSSGRSYRSMQGRHPPRACRYKVALARLRSVNRLCTASWSRRKFARIA
jgi:hypothetical protein